MRWIALVMLLACSVRVFGQRTAEMPDSWLVLYNTNVPDSVSWAQWYAEQWQIPTEHLVGLNASTNEHLTTIADAQTQIYTPVQGFLDAHPDIASKIMGIVVGYRVPGHCGVAGYGIGGYSVSNSLQNLSSDAMDVNPHCPKRWGDILNPRITKDNLTPGYYAIARLDSIDLPATKEMTLRAKRIRLKGLNLCPVSYAWYDWDDPAYLPTIWSALKLATGNTPFVTWREYNDDIDQTPNDAFRFGWHDVRNWNNGRLAGLPAGSRIIAFDLDSWGATTVRSTTADQARFVPNAIAAGYAAAIGATGEPSSLTSVYVDTLLHGLHSGWTLGEAYFQATAYSNWMWELHGDPFLKVFDWSPVPLTPDFDGDSDVDLVDYAAFQMCFNGPNQLPAQANCQQTDFDLDCDVDLADFSVFQSCFNGPNRPLRCQPP